MGVGDDALVFSGNDPSGAGPGFGRAGEPRHPVVGFEGTIYDSGEAFSDFGGIGGGVGLGEAQSEEETAGEEAADIHGGVGKTVVQGRCVCEQNWACFDFARGTL